MCKLMTVCSCACSCPAGHPVHELDVLQQILGKLSVMHVSKSVKKNAVPFNLPQIDPNIVSSFNTVRASGRVPVQFSVTSVTCQVQQDVQMQLTNISQTSAVGVRNSRPSHHESHDGLRCCHASLLLLLSLLPVAAITFYHCGQINEIMRKGAEDTQMLLQKAGEAANCAFHSAGA
jgi:hypothetical protein